MYGIRAARFSDSQVANSSLILDLLIDVAQFDDLLDILVAAPREVENDGLSTHRLYYELAINPATMDEFLKAFYMILNVAIGGTLGGAPDATTPWPQTMLVDWVRVYQEVAP